MRVELQPNEVDVLRNALQHYLSELRAEIAGTERLAWREPMHAEEEAIKSILQRLPETEESPPAEAPSDRRAL